MERLAKLKVPNVSQAMGQLFPLLGLITVIKQTMPPEGHEALNYCRRALRSLLNPFCFYTINEFEGNLPNDLYKDVHLHLESCKAYNKAKRVTLFRQPNSSSITMRLSDSSDVIVDTYKVTVLPVNSFCDCNSFHQQPLPYFLCSQNSYLNNVFNCIILQ